MSLLKYIAKCKRRKGFTLTELIVSIALIALIMATVAAFVEPVQKLIKNADAKSDALTITETVGNYIEHRLAYADYVQIFVNNHFADGTSGDAMYDQMLDRLGNIYKRMTYDGTKQTDGTYIAKQNNYAGMMVFHFEEDTADPLKSTYKIYDVPITKGKMFATSYDDSTGAYSNYKTIEELLNTKKFRFEYVCTEDHLLYKDEFFGGYEYFYTIDDPDPQTYLKLRIEAYNFHQGTGLTAGLTEDIVKSYHSYNYTKYRNNKGESLSLPQNLMDSIAFERTAVENLSFRYTNLRPSSYEINYAPNDTTPTNMSYAFSPDIYILYNVRTYDTANDRLSYS